MTCGCWSDRESPADSGGWAGGDWPGGDWPGDDWPAGALSVSVLAASPPAAWPGLFGVASSSVAVVSSVAAASAPGVAQT